jgi:hypothetical protein
MNSLEIFCDEAGHTGPKLLDPDPRSSCRCCEVGAIHDGSALPLRDDETCSRERRQMRRHRDLWHTR